MWHIFGLSLPGSYREGFSNKEDNVLRIRPPLKKARWCWLVMVVLGAPTSLLQNPAKEGRGVHEKKPVNFHNAALSSCEWCPHMELPIWFSSRGNRGDRADCLPIKPKRIRCSGRNLGKESSGASRGTVTLRHQPRSWHGRHDGSRTISPCRARLQRERSLRNHPIRGRQLPKLLPGKDCFPRPKLPTNRTPLAVAGWLSLFSCLPRPLSLDRIQHFGLPELSLNAGRRSGHDAATGT
ncbi:hypothetical protein VTI28DRAFT_4071 [Corynascus sepedonium]